LADTDRRKSCVFQPHNQQLLSWLPNLWALIVLDGSLYSSEYFVVRKLGWLGQFSLLLLLCGFVGTTSIEGLQMHRKTNVKTMLALAALGAVTLAAPASAWQDGYEIIGEIPVSASGGADIVVYVDALRGKVYTGQEVISSHTNTVIKYLTGYSVIAGDALHGKVYIRDGSASTIFVLDTDTDKITGSFTLATGGVRPDGFAVDALHEKLIAYADFSEPQPTAWVADLRTGKTLNTFSLLPVGATARAAAVDDVHQTIYLSIQYNVNGAAPYAVFAIDENTGKIKANIPIPVISQWLSVDQEKGLLYVAGTGYSNDNSVDLPGSAIVINTRTNKIVETVTTAPANTGGSQQTITEEVVPDPASDIVYASQFSNSTVTAFDVKTGKIVATITMPEKMFGLGIDPFRRKVYAQGPFTGNLYVISAPGWGKLTFGQ
jgi:hypothetical protein